MVGFRPIAAYDIDPSAVEVYNSNLPAVAAVSDLAKTEPEVKNPDVLLAGSPCQGFSTSGKRFVADPRNQLVFRAGLIALKLRPTVFLLENVPAALSGEHQRHWELVEGMLRWHGYNVRRFIAEGTESGLAQLRRRLFMVAWLGSDCIRFEPTKVKPFSLADALAGVESVADHEPIALKAGSREALIAARIPPGMKLCNVRASPAAVHTWNVPEVFGAVDAREIEVLLALMRLRRQDRRRDFGDADPVLPAVIARYLGRSVRKQLESLFGKAYLRRIGPYVDLWHTYNGKFRRPRWEAASPTVDTHFGDPILFLHPSQNRGFSSREAARIQGFQDDFIFRGSRRKRFEMVGNAVPPPMARRLAGFIREALI